MKFNLLPLGTEPATAGDDDLFEEWCSARSKGELRSSVLFPFPRGLVECLLDLLYLFLLEPRGETDLSRESLSSEVLSRPLQN